jgi:hypothetical protein
MEVPAPLTVSPIHSNRNCRHVLMDRHYGHSKPGDERFHGTWGKSPHHEHDWGWYEFTEDDITFARHLGLSDNVSVQFTGGIPDLGHFVIFGAWTTGRKVPWKNARAGRVMRFSCAVKQ